MNTWQKIIKYFAIGFACFLIFTILSGIVFGALGILTATKLIEKNSHVEISCEVDEEPCLEIAMAASELVIKKGDKLYAESEYDKVEIKQEGNRIAISEGNANVFGDYDKRTTTVYVPEDMEFKKVGISGGAGRIYIEAIKAKEMELSLGVGETSVDSLEVDKIKVSAGIGAVNLHLASPASEYKVKISKGIGDARFNGKVVGNDETFGDGVREVEVSGGIGAIDITTVEEKKAEE